MNTFKASALSHKRSEVMKAAREGGAIIQECRTNGEVLQEFIIISRDLCADINIADGDGNQHVLTAFKRGE